MVTFAVVVDHTMKQEIEAMKRHLEPRNEESKRHCSQVVYLDRMADEFNHQASQHYLGFRISPARVNTDNERDDEMILQEAVEAAGLTITTSLFFVEFVHERQLSKPMVNKLLKAFHRRGVKQVGAARAPTLFLSRWSPRSFLAVCCPAAFQLKQDASDNRRCKGACSRGGS